VTRTPQDPWKTQIEQTVKHAEGAHRLTMMLPEQLGLYEFNDCDERVLVALPLLRSSIDMAAAATKLLTIDPVTYGGAAEAMFRPQLERYMRAVLFGSPNLTDDDEVHAFREEDEMPRRPKPPPGKKSPKITFDDLTATVASEIVQQTHNVQAALAEGLSDAIVFEKEGLHGAVHGGRIVIRRYSSDGGILAHNPWALAQGHHIQCVTALGLLALVQAAHLYGVRNNTNEFRATNAFAKLLSDMYPGMPKPLSQKTDRREVNKEQVTVDLTVASININIQR